MATFEIYKDTAGSYRWRLKAGNNEIVAWGEGYTSKQNAENAANWVKTNAPGATVIDLTQPKAAARHW